MKKLLLVIMSSFFVLEPVSAQPSINAVTGDINTTLTISGSGFTAKTNPKPLFWWKADFGTSPSTLGRMTAWSDDDNLGTLSTAIVAPGSQQSYGTDHGSSSGIALSRVNFDSNQLYLYRKTYEDFDITTDEAINARINLTSGTLKVGDIITGQTSGATAQIVSFKEVHPNITYMTHILKYNNVSGSINDQPQVDFVDGEQMTSSSNAVMSSVNFFRTFNFKTIRMWSRKYDNIYPRNNMHFNAQGTNGSKFRITPEYTDGTTWSGQFTNQVLHQLPREWKVEELQYQTSDISVKNGIFNFYQKGILGTDNKFTNRKPDEVDANGKTISYSRKYNSIVQSQVSHNAQPGSVMYYDQLYIDDTWHRVVISENSAWATRSNVEVQIPVQWNDNLIVVQANPGSLNSSSALYLYVVDKDGIANGNGYPLTPGSTAPVTPASDDFNGDGKADIFWRNAVTNENKIHIMNSNSVTSEANVSIPATAAAGWEVVGYGDFNGDVKTDILWRNSGTGQNHISLMNGTATPGGVSLSIPALTSSQWKIAGVGDFDGDDNPDIFWHHDSGENRITLMNGTNQTSTVVVNTIADTNWKVAGIADINNDGNADVLWRNGANRRLWLYLMNGNVISNGAGSGEHVAFTSDNWNIEGVGDFDSDGRGDILWRHNTNGRVWLYLMNGSAISNGTSEAPGQHVDFTALDWDIVAVNDYNADGKQDIFWRNNVDGRNYMYLMNGAFFVPAGGSGGNTLTDLNWRAQDR